MLVKAVVTWVPSVDSVELTVEIACKALLVPDTFLTASWIFFTSCSSSPASVSRLSFAFLPDSVSGVPSPLSSSTNLLVDFAMSEEAESSDSFVTFPFSELVVDCTEVDQVEIDEQRLFAQLSADVVLLLLLPPHPAASTPRATTAMTKLLPRAPLHVLGIEQKATAAATQSIVCSG